MLILPLEQAKPGMKLVMAVSHPEHPDQELLKPGYILDQTVLAKLRSLGVLQIFVDYPDLADLDRHLLPHLSPARQVVYSQIKNTISAIQKTVRPTVGFSDYYSSTRDLILTLLQQGDNLIFLDILSGSAQSDAIVHATAVAQLSLTMGLRLERYIVSQRSRLSVQHAREIVNLGVAAMLHDLGQIKLPSHLQRYSEADPPTNDAHRSEWESHPALGHEMLRTGIEASGAAAVLQHHQHFDGSGFPKIAIPARGLERLAENNIHVFARIIYVANLYERLGSHPDQPGRRSSLEILHLLQTQYKPFIDPYILRTLPSVIPPFPPGCRVSLSDGSSAVITCFDPADPYHPTVRRIGDDNWTLTGDPIPLAAEQPLTIHSLGGLAVDKMLKVAEAA
jgi:HD-GYP domain-containing protein (c-di-GMP phosphodiesterase class II)